MRVLLPLVLTASLSAVAAEPTAIPPMSTPPVPPVTANDCGAATAATLSEIFNLPDARALRFAAELTDARTSLNATNVLVKTLQADLATRDKEIADLKARLTKNTERPQ